MIDDKKIEEAARQHAMGAFVSEYWQACYKEGFVDCAKWAINEFLKDLWHPASEIPSEGKHLIVEYSITDTIKDYVSLKRLDNNYIYWDWVSYFESANVTRWLYIDDLFPKEGGEQ